MKQKIVFADQLRVLAVFFVVLAHYFGVFWYDPALLHFTNIFPSTIDRKVPDFVAFVNTPSLLPHRNWGPLGVDIFFLISGFVIPISLERYNWKQFLVQRFLRLYPTYFVAFLFVAFLLLLSSYYFDNTFLYSVKILLIHAILGGREWMNIPIIDTVIWTLEVELKFYFLSALFIVLFHKKSLYIFCIPVVLSLVIYYYLPTYLTLIHVVYMYIGTVFYYHFKAHITTFQAMALTVMIFTLFSLLYLVLGKGFLSLEYLNQMVCNGIYALLIFTIAYILRENFRYNKYLAFVSGISYPFYIIHSVSGYILMAILGDFGLAIFISMPLTLLFLIGIAYALHIWIEMPSQKLGKKLTLKL